MAPLSNKSEIMGWLFRIMGYERSKTEVCLSVCLSIFQSAETEIRNSFYINFLYFVVHNYHFILFLYL